MTRKSLASLLATAVVLGACEPQARADTRADGPGYPPEILTRQDLQSLVEAGLDRRVEPLAQALGSADPLMRATASCALASFQPHALGGELEKRLQDDDTRARHCAAFAIGQLGLHGESSIGALFGALSAESNQAVRTALLEAIGKVGTGEDLAQLLGMAHSLRPTDDHGLALALYHFGRRRITHPDAAPHIARLAAAQDERTAHIAGLALGTSRDPVDWGLSARDVRGLLDATPWDRRSAGPLLSVLARVAAPEDAARARSWLERAKHWTVAAAAARALGPYAGSDTLSTAALIRALDDTSPHIATTAAQVLASRASGIHGAVSWEGLVRSTMDRPAVAAALLPALVGTPGESLVLTWADGRSNAPAFYAWPALARTRLPEADDLLLRALQGDRRRAYIAAAALADRLEAGNGAESLRARVARILPERLGLWGPHAPASDVRGLTRLLAHIARDASPDATAVVRAASRHAHPLIREAVRQLQTDTDDTLLPRRPVDWTLLAQSGTRPRLEMRTTHGAFVVELDPLVAPLAVSALLDDARSGRLSGLAFHRVEPDFILQSGDFDNPDGYGGPASGLRSELSTLRFEPGVMGMASAGRDTEGSQYFITHNYAPSLDGRYGAVGRIVRGAEIADAVGLNDPVRVVVLP